MDVTGANSVGGAGAIRPADFAPVHGAPEAAPTGLEAPQDEVEISSAARMLDQLHSDPLVRAERLAEIRAAIDAGTYDTPEKLEIALERMLGVIHRGDA